LEALPGATVNHLDMILKFVDSDTALIPSYQSPPVESLNRYQLNLTNRVREVLKNNEDYLRKNLPEVELIPVPMPPIMFKSADEIFSEVRTEFLEMMALGLEVLTAEELSRLSAKGRTNLETKMREVIQNEMGYADLDTFTGFDAVLRHYQRLPLTKYIDLHSEPVTRYRSYINSVFLHNSTGKHGFVIPRFTAKHPVENQRLREWETQVQTAYRKAWPKAQIHWINCDSMVPDMGFVHCMTLTVPAKR
jgi:agmatine/peptidylarginine deiminase